VLKREAKVLQPKIDSVGVFNSRILLPSDYGDDCAYHYQSSAGIYGFFCKFLIYGLISLKMSSD